LSFKLRDLVVDFLLGQDMSWMGTGSAREVECGMLELRRVTDSAILQVISQRLRDLDGRLVDAGVPCRQCGKPMTRNRPEDHAFDTALGPMTLWRSYLECRDDNERHYPLDAHLALPAMGRMMPARANAITQLGAELPYEAGSRLLEALTGQSVAARTIDDQVQRDGSTLHRLECEEADRLWPHDPEGHARPVGQETIRAVREESVARPRPPGRVLVMQMDGAMVNLAADPKIKKERARCKKKARAKGGQPLPEAEAQDGSPYRESIQIVIYRSDDVVCKRRGKYGKPKRRRGKKSRRERTIITHKQTTCVVNDPPMVAKQVHRQAQLWRYQEYEERVFLSDGAEKHWDIAKAYFDFTVGILDINHARSHIHECARVLYSREGNKARQWGRSWCRRLLADGPKALLAHLCQLQAEAWSEEGARKVANLIEYVTTHQSHMNYPDYMAKGYPIASGAVEGTNKHVMISRCRRAGQQFKRTNVQNLLALRAALVDGRWERAMEKVRENQAYGRPPRNNARESERQIAGHEAGQRKREMRRPQSPPRNAAGPSEQPTALEKLIPWRKQVRLIRTGLGHHLLGGVPMAAAA
jgi:hypothetical protein